MPLWGTAHASDENKPKFLTTDEDSDYTRQDSYATQGGWAMRPGTKATGNGNTSADPEILVAIGDLAGSTDTTGLRAPTVTHMRFINGGTATTDYTAIDGTGRIEVEITWDEEVTVAGAPRVVVANGNQSSAGQGNYTLEYVTANSTANRLRFKKTSASLSVSDVLTLGGANFTLNSCTISDTVREGTNQAASLVLSGLTAVTVTIAA